MSDQVRAVDCPSCGAPLKMPREYDRYFKCEFCGSTLEDQTPAHERETGQVPKLIVYSTPSIAPTTISSEELLASSKRAARNLFFVILGISVVAVLIPLLIIGILKPPGNMIANPLESLRIYSFALSHLVPSDDGTQPDLVSITRNSDETTRMVYLDFDQDPYLRWRSEPLGEGSDYYYNLVVPGDASIYFAYKTTLAAFNRLDGVILWQTTMSDEITNICVDCLQVFGNRLVALTTDGVLSGFDALSGQQAWSFRLNETPRQLLDLAGRPAVLDKEDDLIGINVYDPSDGTIVKRLVPECPNEIFLDSPQHLGIYDHLFLSSDSLNLYIPIADYDPGCLQSWDAASLSQSWQASVPYDILDAIDWYSYLFTDEALYLSADHDLYMVSLRDSTYQAVYSNEDYELTPLAAQDGMLLVLAERTRGTTQYALWGIDLASKSKRWELTPAAKDLYDGTSSVVYEDGLFTAAINGDKVILLEAFSEPGSVAFTVLNLSDGSQLRKNSLSLQEDSSYWIQVVAWGADRVYLEGGDHIRMIDFNSGAELIAWP
ncbi:MAG: PQQ-binding-like beta-propeller repeat protein [Anaerolineales bacterium]|nr:PQQ-binding-like beta-propeller repeat protein [Anaerolineales bacterium]